MPLATLALIQSNSVHSILFLEFIIQIKNLFVHDLPKLGWFPFQLLTIGQTDVDLTTISFSAS